jgi:methylmalonyl-CoA mutase, N-terminal domain
LNKFTVEEEIAPDLLRVDASVTQKQQKRLAALRQRRDAAAVQQALAVLENAAPGRDNLMPYILSAVEVYATTGEICHTLRRVWGEYRQPVML